MISLVQAEARQLISIADVQSMVKAASPAVPILLRSDLEDPLVQSPVVLDGYRRRPRYFDGRFLTGADLTRDQDYVRQRQSDMARASGAGVISGLRLASDLLGPGQTLTITPGVGLTPSGDLVMLSSQQSVPLLDLPTSRQLDAALGLSEDPRVPLERTTGLFILALRPVEFTANPIAAYPRSITGKRTVEDGDIIEASAITLIPYPDMAGAADISDARRKVARAIFASRGGAMPQDALPLAMIGLDRGTVRWVDGAMVRREIGAESGVQAIFGGRARAISEAFVLQHQAHLDDALLEMVDRTMGSVFPAASLFSLLPPTGPMPFDAIQSDDLGFSQLYFPPGLNVDIAFAPADEIPVLAEEALDLPPIDLEGPADDLDATSITILIPVDRARYQKLRATLSNANMAVATNAASPSTTGAFDLVSDIMARRAAAQAPAVDPSAAAAAQAQASQVQAWRSALTDAATIVPKASSGARLAWYIRRRSIAVQAGSTGNGIALSSDDVSLNAAVYANIDRLKLTKRLAAIDGQATPQATVRLLSLLGSPGVANSDILTVSVISDMEKVISGTLPPPPATGTTATTSTGAATIAAATAAGTTTAARDDTDLKLGESEVLAIAQDYSDLRLGEGLARAAAAIGGGWPAAADAAWLGGSGKAPAVDLAFRNVGEEKLADFATLLKSAVTDQSSKELDDLLANMA